MSSSSWPILERDFPSRSRPDSHVYSRDIGKQLPVVVVEARDHDEVVTAYYPTSRKRRQR